MEFVQLISYGKKKMNSCKRLLLCCCLTSTVNSCGHIRMVSLKLDTHPTELLSPAHVRDIFISIISADTMLRIEMEDWDGNKYFAEYDSFSISSEKDNYRLHVSGYHGNAGDSLTASWQSHDQKPFSTYDKDNDDRFYDNCAEKYFGAWWFNDCFESHLNGKYYEYGSHNNYFIRNGVQWNSIHSYSSLKFVEMMIKSNDVVKLPNDV